MSDFGKVERLTRGPKSSEHIQPLCVSSWTAVVPLRRISLDGCECDSSHREQVGLGGNFCQIAANVADC